MPKERRKIDWKKEMQRQQALEVRDKRWRANSRIVMKHLKIVVIAWFLLRHGADITEIAATVVQDAANIPLPAR